MRSAAALAAILIAFLAAPPQSAAAIAVEAPTGTADPALIASLRSWLEMVAERAPAEVDAVLRATADAGAGDEVVVAVELAPADGSTPIRARKIVSSASAPATARALARAGIAALAARARGDSAPSPEASPGAAAPKPATPVKSRGHSLGLVAAPLGHWYGHYQDSRVQEDAIDQLGLASPCLALDYTFARRHLAVGARAAFEALLPDAQFDFFVWRLFLTAGINFPTRNPNLHFIFGLRGGFSPGRFHSDYHDSDFPDGISYATVGACAEIFFALQAFSGGWGFRLELNSAYEWATGVGAGTGDYFLIRPIQIGLGILRRF